MNTGDAEVVWSVLRDNGYAKVERAVDADLYLVVTCSIRDSAEEKVWRKLRSIKHKKKAKLYRYNSVLEARSFYIGDGKED